MAAIRVHLLGTLTVCSETGDEIPLDGGKIRELLCFLLLNRDRLLSRETLAAVFWADVPTAKSRKHLRQALWHLLAELNASPSLSVELLRVDPEGVFLDSSAVVWLDVAVLEQAFVHAHGIPGHSLDRALADELRAAATLYRGDLLEGWYQDWCILERERFQAAYVTILDKLMAYAEAHHAHEEGLQYGAHILRYDRARESTHRRLMRLHALAGDRTAALRQYERCASALQDELGVRPTRTTDHLLEQIRADRLLDEPRWSDAHGGSSPTTQDLVTELRRLRAGLDDVHAQVQRELQTVELLLNRFS